MISFFVLLLGSFQSLSEFVTNVYGGKLCTKLICRLLSYLQDCEFKSVIKNYINHSCCDNTYIDSVFFQILPIYNKCFISKTFFVFFSCLATKEEMLNKNTVNAKGMTADDSRKKYELLQNQVEALQTEIMNVQIKYQKELEKLEKENRDLRQQYLIIKTNRKTTIGKKIKVDFIS